MNRIEGRNWGILGEGYDLASQIPNGSVKTVKEILESFGGREKLLFESEENLRLKEKAVEVSKKVFGFLTRNPNNDSTNLRSGVLVPESVNGNLIYKIYSLIEPDQNKCGVEIIGQNMRSGKDILIQVDFELRKTLLFQKTLGKVMNVKVSLNQWEVEVFLNGIGSLLSKCKENKSKAISL